MSQYFSTMKSQAILNDKQAKELAQYNMDIAVRLEIFLSDEDNLSEAYSGYTFSMKGKPRGEKQD